MTEGHQYSLGDGISESDHLGETSSLQRHLFQKTRSIHNAGDEYITDSWEFFLDTGAGIEGAVADGNVTQVSLGTEGGIQGNE